MFRDEIEKKNLKKIKNKTNNNQKNENQHWNKQQLEDIFKFWKGGLENLGWREKKKKEKKNLPETNCAFVIDKHHTIV
jgi:hypothetical protein